MYPNKELLDRLARSVPGGYQPNGRAASEPTAWAAIALARGGRLRDARRAADWLARVQQRSGAVGVDAEQDSPAWPTSLAMLAWKEVQSIEGSASYQHAIDNATEWSLEAKGRTVERKPQIGHDTTLVGWSWAADTHSWLEPSAMFVTALRAVGQRAHPRVREGVRLLFDRLLPSGGANYGNTTVLGQELLPHVQPTGVALLALAGEQPPDDRLSRAVAYLRDSLGPQTTTASLSYGLMGLTAQRERPHEADDWITAAAARLNPQRAAAYKLALLAMALPSPAAPPIAADNPRAAEP